MIIPVKTSTTEYAITLKKGALDEVGSILNLDRKVLIVTDSGVPESYSQTVAKYCKSPVIYTIPQGESSKNIDNFTSLLKLLVEENFTRTDCVAAVGGGVVGDLAGFVASSFMRGVDFYNIPTTVLSQVDSSIGGKVAIDFCGVKNIVGAFYPPKAVVIDPDVLLSLPPRQISNGLCEAVKMAATNSEDLFRFFETEDVFENLETVIEKSIEIKKSVVEQDEKESGLRRVLNFGHTLGHAIESTSKADEFYHGECVSMGMVYMCSKSVKDRLVPVLEKLNLPVKTNIKNEKILDAVRHDKKASGEKITAVYVQKIGSFEFKEYGLSDFEKILKGKDF